jgi:hypothetical protein
MASSGLLRRVVLTRALRLYIPEDGSLHSHRSENLRSYIILFCILIPFSAHSTFLQHLSFRNCNFCRVLLI